MGVSGDRRRHLPIPPPGPPRRLFPICALAAGRCQSQIPALSSSHASAQSPCLHTARALVSLPPGPPAQRRHSVLNTVDVGLSLDLQEYTSLHYARFPEVSQPARAPPLQKPFLSSQNRRSRLCPPHHPSPSPETALHLHPRPHPPHLPPPRPIHRAHVHLSSSLTSFITYPPSRVSKTAHPYVIPTRPAPRAPPSRPIVQATRTLPASARRPARCAATRRGECTSFRMILSRALPDLSTPDLDSM